MADADPRRSPLSGFILVGVAGPQDGHSYLWPLLLVVYLLILAGNGTVVYMVTTDKRLHRSTHFLTANLGVVDLVLATVVLPTMLVGLMWDARVILWRNCFIQMYFFHGMSAVRTMTLSLMAYEHSVAICNPQRHLSLNRDDIFVKMAAVIWVLGLTCFLPPVVQASIFPFCGSNKVYNSFCELLSVTRLICPETVSVTLFIVLLNVLLLLSSLLIIVCSYIKVAKSVRITTQPERRRVWSTCIPHVAAIWMFFPLKILYSTAFCASCLSPAFGVSSALLYVILNPLVSPFVYIITTKEMKEKIAKLIIKAPHIGSTVSVEGH
ncbi:olfactory receptor 1M1-like [Mobula birostris]|uniref:olfactory receptor 1M1-like n=1 Tax=Mobula birostris TaxID=1983395 RepID=UPI003B27DD83